MLTKYDTWKTDSPLTYAKQCKCGMCKTTLNEGDSVIVYNGNVYCDQDCYYEQLCRDNEPRYMELEEWMM